LSPRGARTSRASGGRAGAAGSPETSATTNREPKLWASADMLAFDAVLAAVALARGAEALVSADRAFASVPGLTWIDPAAPDVNPYLGD